MVFTFDLRKRSALAVICLVITVWRSVVKKMRSRAHSARDLSLYNFFTFT